MTWELTPELENSPIVKKIAAYYMKRLDEVLKKRIQPEYHI